MRVVCAWCRREGRPDFLGEKAPFDDRSETHSVCEPHRRRELEALESRSFPGIKLLVVVGPREQGLYDYLTRTLDRMQDVAVIMERRQHERRRQPGGQENERRRRERRLRRGSGPSSLYRYVRFGRTERE